MWGVGGRVGVGRSGGGRSEISKKKTEEHGNVKEALHAWPRVGWGVPQQVPMLAPHELFSAMYSAGMDVFRRCALGDRPFAVVSEYWEWAMQQPFGVVHPATQDPAVLDQMLPLVFHYDGAEAYTNEEAHIWSMGSFFAPRDVWDARYLVCVIMNVHVCEPELLHGAHEAVCRFLAWSLNWCQKAMPHRSVHMLATPSVNTPPPHTHMHPLPHKNQKIKKNTGGLHHVGGWVCVGGGDDETYPVCRRFPL